MRALAAALALALAMPAAAQQVRKFEELEKKREPQKK